MAPKLYRLSMIFSENRLSPRIKCGAGFFRIMLPPRAMGDAPGKNPEHNSGPISSLLVAADVADDVGDVLVAFLLVGDEGGIIIVVVFDGLVDLDVVFRFGNDGLDLAGILLGVGLLERHQLFSLDRLRRGFGGSGGRGCRGAGGRVGAGPRRRDRRNRHHLAGLRRNHRTLVEVVEFLTRRRANTFGSEIGFGHVWNPGNLSKNGASLG